MDSQRLMLHALVLMTTCCLAVTWARMGGNSLPVREDEEGVDMGDSPLPEELFASEDDATRGGAKRTNQEDISKLLLKHLRFRQLPEPASSTSLAGPAFTRHARRPAHQEKRHEQRMLVNNLAALLSGLRDRQVESSMRMPSLRFGK
ncbi:uncharacterized protein LOC143276141 [Babylonia areolata]|uniref:uncharacterized protein LOC143276141 n=1 Tax=Babylonia areolata TaxID=304850 RepID=UPI003FD34154